MIRRLIGGEEALRQCGATYGGYSGEEVMRKRECDDGLRRRGTIHEVEYYFAIRNDFEVDSEPMYRMRVRERDGRSDDHFIETDQGDLAFVYSESFPLPTHGSAAIHGLCSLSVREVERK